ncbi:HK97 gp10 family phage protein [Nonomuraea angiospora]|uniref:HK97 gp10 family phage protein n=1 Tax=Nonomuraea angiospora TaxID=46172 RepID=UPI0029A9705D|nr:HK97 gp10 family phage protein [Nonomuraea angiospora]MDX3101755.1 HK97 gp10 family phage protein [Nonomuraea angiospora]
MAEPTDPSQAIAELAKDLGKIPPELRKAMRPALKAAAEPIVQDAKGRASWSTRIPRAISLSVRFGKRDPGVSIRVRRGAAPHGRPYEGITGASTFRHPVFGHRDRWVSQETRPYLAPAAEAGMEGALAASVEAVDQVAREQGFR